VAIRRQHGLRQTTVAQGVARRTQLARQVQYQGRRRACYGLEVQMKSTKVLMDEHKLILRALNVLEQMAVNVEHGKQPDGQDVEDILRFLRLFADDHHQVKEEAVLFPAMLKSGDRNSLARLQWMTFEHNQERSLVEGLEDALRTNKGADFVYFAERLNHILRTHIHKEDHILFEFADDALSADEDERVANELVKFDAGFDQKVLKPLLERICSLERKYLGKAA
jgi:hemerythrin-like domain-containing protein